MGDGERILLKPWAENPYFFGFEVGAAPVFGVPTVVSNYSLGVNADLKFFWSNNANKSFFINGEYSYYEIDGKILSDDSSGFNLDSHTFKLGFGKRTRSKSFTTKEGHKWGSFVTESTPHIGGGTLAVPSHDRSIDGEGTETLPGGGSGFLDMGTTHSLGFEFRPITGSRFQLTLMPNLAIGYRFAGTGEDSGELNAMYINFGINLMLGFADISTNTSNRYTINDHALAVYKKFHGFGLRFVSDAVMNKGNELLDGSGLLGGGDEDDKLSTTEQIKMLSSISSFSSALGGGSIDSFMETGDWRWLYFALEMATGAGSLGFGQSVSSKGAGAGDIVNGLGMLSYTAFGLDTPEKRAMKGDKLGNYMAYAFATRLLFNSLIFFTGVGIGENDAGSIITSAGNQANLSLASNPAPGTDEAPYVSYNWIPVTGYFGKNSGMRGGLLIDVSFKNPSWLYTQSRILSHGLTPSNIGNRFTEDGPYSGSTLPSSIETTFGAQYSSKYFRIGAGLDFANLFGGDASSAFGASARLMLRIPITEQIAITAGAYGTAHKFLRVPGAEYEVGGFAGIELFKWK